MQKSIIALLLVALTAASATDVFQFAAGNIEFDHDLYEGSSTENAINFFEGLGKGLDQETAAKALIKCSYNDTNGLIQDIQTLINDIQDKKW
mmetsp:Transcript_104539/g.145675  ORF Transcript_104539/g.145675 Transcript_104539/m.145675 type:complete len:92 (+) Transcript_104539:48-323(+)